MSRAGLGCWHFYQCTQRAAVHLLLLQIRGTLCLRTKGDNDAGGGGGERGGEERRHEKQSNSAAWKTDTLQFTSWSERGEPQTSLGGERVMVCYSGARGISGPVPASPRLSISFLSTSYDPL